MKKSNGHKRKRGFSLPEIAITLAVVVGVVGGIWAAASAVMENHKINETTKGYTLYANKVQNLISLGQAKQQWGSDDGSATIDVVKMEIPPKHWIKGNTVITPMGYQLSFADLSMNDGVSTGGIYKGTFWLRLNLMPQHSCIKFVVALSTTNPQKDIYSGLKSIYVRDEVTNSSNGRIDVNNFPISPAQAATLCRSTFNNVNAIYPYSRMN